MTEKIVSAIMSGMEVALAFVQMFMNKAKNAGLTDKDVHRLFTPEGEKLIDKFVDMLNKAFHPKPAQMTYVGTYNVLVDYDRSIEELVEDIATSFVSCEICSESFPPIRTGRKVRRIVLVNFGERLETAEVINKLREQGFRPVNAQELLTLGCQEADDIFNMATEVVALGQLTDRIINDGSSLSCINMDCSYESLMLLRILYFANEEVWGQDTVFPAIFDISE